MNNERQKEKMVDTLVSKLFNELVDKSRQVEIMNLLVTDGRVVLETSIKGNSISLRVVKDPELMKASS